MVFRFPNPIRLDLLATVDVGNVRFRLDQLHLVSEPVEVTVSRSSVIIRQVRNVGQCAHSRLANRRETVDGCKPGIVNAYPLQTAVEQKTIPTVRQAVVNSP